MPTVDASIIIPAWNSEETIRDSIESVLAQKTASSFEVIVVDSSSDRTADIVKEYPEVKLIKLEKRTFSGAARNIGVAESEGPVILFIDSDVIVEPRWLNKMLDWHQRDDCAVITGAVLNGNPESLVSWASYITEFSEYLPIGPPRYRMIGVTANFSCKREALKRLGGFNSDLKQYVDTEFNCRLNSNGGKLLFVPGILAKHKQRTEMWTYLKHELNRGRSAVAVRRLGYLPFSRIASYRWLCALAAGPMFVRLAFCNVRRFIKAGILSFKELMCVIPFSVMGQFAWAVGFFVESVHPRIKLQQPDATPLSAEAVQAQRR